MSLAPSVLSIIYCLVTVQCPASLPPSLPRRPRPVMGVRWRAATHNDANFLLIGGTATTHTQNPIMEFIHSNPVNHRGRNTRVGFTIVVSSARLY